MKRGSKIQINFTNRFLYTFVAFIILSIIGVGVFALTPGVAPNPGHLIDDVAPPAGCGTDQILKWDGSLWICIDSSTLQERVTGSCSPGESIRVINSDGTVVCEIDDVESGLTECSIGARYLSGDGTVCQGWQWSSYSSGDVIQTNPANGGRVCRVAIRCR